MSWRFFTIPSKKGKLQVKEGPSRGDGVALVRSMSWLSVQISPLFSRYQLIKNHPDLQKKTLFRGQRGSLNFKAHWVNSFTGWIHSQGCGMFGLTCPQLSDVLRTVNYGACRRFSFLTLSARMLQAKHFLFPFHWTVVFITAGHARGQRWSLERVKLKARQFYRNSYIPFKVTSVFCLIFGHLLIIE